VPVPNPEASGMEGSGVIAIMDTVMQSAPEAQDSEAVMIIINALIDGWCPPRRLPALNLGAQSNSMHPTPRMSHSAALERLRGGHAHAPRTRTRTRTHVDKGM